MIRIGYVNSGYEFNETIVDRYRGVIVDIKQLIYFLQIATDENYTIASKKLYISQPALSKAIKNLEDELGIKLFHYNDKRTRLTDEGYNFYIKAKGLIEGYHQLLDSVHDTRQSIKGHLKIGIPPVVGQCYFAEIISKFSNEYPDIYITIVETGANKIQKDVYVEELDVGVIVMPAYSNRFNVTQLIEDESVLLVHKDHPLAKVENITYIHLRDEKFIIFNEDFTLHDNIIAACRKNGFEPLITVKSSQWDFIVEMVSHNLGVSILPRPVLMRYNHERIEIKHINDELSVWRIAMVSKKDGYLSRVGEIFIEFVKQSFINGVLPEK